MFCRPPCFLLCSIPLQHMLQGISTYSRLIRNRCSAYPQMTSETISKCAKWKLERAVLYRTILTYLEFSLKGRERNKLKTRWVDRGAGTEWFCGTKNVLVRLP
jgi:hypothetical protein